MPKAKPFIDKKKAVTFQLVHRSQQDPLVADEKAPQRVLLPVPGKEPAADKEKRIDEQHKYGIFFDDDYNYLQHLKDSKDNTLAWPDNVDEELKTKRAELSEAKLKLPSSVFASEIEEEVGMLNKAAPVTGLQLHLDPDIVAAMDEDFDYSDPENELEDNFIELAQGVASDQEFDDEDGDYELGSDFDEERDEVGSLPGSGRSFDEEETKSRFTSYSMTSSVIRRNNQLTLLDDRFEKMYADYDENEIGALDCEEIEGHVPESSELLLQYADEFQKSQKRELLEKATILAKINENDCTSDDEEVVLVPLAEKEKWDCESILSTYSNIYNHPKLIAEPKNMRNKIQINARTGIPKNVLDSNKLTTKALKELDQETDSLNAKCPKSYGGQSIISQLSVLSIRNPHETPEEKKERKKALKEYRKERRLERKVNAQAFKEEAKRQIKITMNNKNNVQGNRIL